MVSWEEYIKNNILEFRRVVGKYAKESVYSLSKPSQVVAVDFNGPFPKCLIILHSEQYPDMEVFTFENETPEDYFSKISKEKPKWLELLGIGGIEAIHEDVKAMPHLAWVGDWSVQIVGESFLILKRSDPRSEDFFLFRIAQLFIKREFELKKRRKQIEESMGTIKKEAEAIPTEELRTKIVKATERLEKQIEPLYEKYKKLESDVVGVRKLVGTKGFGEWRALTSDVEYLRTTHITRETLDAHIKRLDEKIDKGLEALHTRIEDLKAIKFWSKRTVLEIALAIMAIIATLYGAGVIKF